ncbi:MAG: hypothetical protein ACLVMF_08915 [Christensenellales bacterium]
MAGRKSCQGCIYHKLANESLWYCGYILVTGQPRGCSADKCIRKKTKAQLRKKRK